MNDVAIADLSPSMSSNEIPRRLLSRCREPPRLVGHTAHSETHRANASAICRQRGGSRYQRELIGCAITNLKIVRGTRLQRSGALRSRRSDRPDPRRCHARRVAGQAMEIRERVLVVRPLAPARSRWRPWRQELPPDRTGWSPRRIETSRRSA